MSERDTIETDFSPIGLLCDASLKDAKTNIERKLLMEFQQVFVEYENEQNRLQSLRRILAVLNQADNPCDEDVNRVREDAKDCAELIGQLDRKMLTIINGKEMTHFVMRLREEKLRKLYGDPGDATARLRNYLLNCDR